ncbi:hypothetical protein KJ633_09020 [bacterium]|nr:hypothetical protein [bacterium]
MVILLLLTAAAPAFFFIYDLWAITAAIFISLPFAFRKHRFPPAFMWILVFILSGIFVSARSFASFDSFTFILQSVLYAAFFLAGQELASRRKRPIVTVPIEALIPLAALAIIPFLFSGKANVNPNIVSSYAGLLFALLIVSPAEKILKYILGAAALAVILVNGSWTVLFVLGAAGILAGKKKYLPLIPLLAVFALALNPRSGMERFLWWGESFKIFAANPLGIGFFASKYYLAAPLGVAPNTLFVHSFFLQLLCEGGILCLIPLGFAVNIFFKNKRGGRYDFALYAVLLLGVMDLSYHITAHGMLGALIIGITLRPEDATHKCGKIYSVVFKTLFISAAFLSVIMFSNSRALARGAAFLFAGDARQAEKVFDKAFNYPAYPALLSAKAAAYSIIAEKEGLSDFRKRSFEFQEKALPAKNLKIPAYRDFVTARLTGNLGLLRNSCMEILFLNGIRPHS